MHVLLKSAVRNLVALTHLVTGQPGQPAPERAQPIIQPHSTAFVFDFHGVIATESPLGMIKKGLVIFRHHPRKAKLLLGLLTFGLNKALKFNQRKLCIEYALTHDELNEAAKQATLNLINPHEIDRNMLAQVRRLHRQGYKLFICSNIGQESFNRYTQQCPELLQLFSGAYVCREENGYTTKKYSRAFELCKNMVDACYHQNAQEAPTTILMVDDSQSKLNRAHTAHNAYHGIHFTTPEHFGTLLDQWRIPRD